MKPAAPADIRGEFKPIASNVPGISVCEHLPKMARWMHRTVVVRSVYHKGGCHNNLPMYTGHDVPPPDDSPRDTDPPSMGSVCLYHEQEILGRKPGAAAELRLSALPAGLGRGAAQAGAVGRLPRPALRPALHRMHGLPRQADEEVRRHAGRPRRAVVPRPGSARRRHPRPPRRPAQPAAADGREDAPTRLRRGPGRAHQEAATGLRPAHVGEGARGVRFQERADRASATATAGRLFGNSVPAGPPAGRARRALRQRQLGQLPRALRVSAQPFRLGHARTQLLHPPPQPPAQPRPDLFRPHGGSRPARPARRDARRDDGRDGPHAEDQQGRRPRPLDVLLLRAAGRRRRSRRPGLRRVRRPRRLHQGQARPHPRHLRHHLPVPGHRPGYARPRPRRPARPDRARRAGAEGDPG